MTKTEKLANLLKELSYDEMMAFTNWISSCAVGWADDHGIGEIDGDYFASTISNWAEENLPS